MPANNPTNVPQNRPVQYTNNFSKNTLMRTILEAFSNLHRQRNLRGNDWSASGITDTSGLCYEHRRKCMSHQRYTPEFKDEALRPHHA